MEIGEGINVDEKIKKIFRAAISQFYYDPKEISLQTAFNLMLKDFFYEDFIVERGVKKNNIFHNAARRYGQFKVSSSDA